MHRTCAYPGRLHALVSTATLGTYRRDRGADELHAHARLALGASHCARVMRVPRLRACARVLGDAGMHFELAAEVGGGLRKQDKGDIHKDNIGGYLNQSTVLGSRHVSYVCLAHLHFVTHSCDHHTEEGRWIGWNL